MSKTILYACGAVLFLLNSPEPSQAQTVSGRVLQEETGALVDGARVLLVDSAGAIAGSTLSNGSGKFLFAGVAPGHYILLAEFIGFRPTTSPAFEVEPGTSIIMDLELAVQPIKLDSVTVTLPRGAKWGRGAFARRAYALVEGEPS